MQRVQCHRPNQIHLSRARSSRLTNSNPIPGVKYSRVTGLVDDLCLALKAESIRIDRMPGKPHVGIEVPNPRRETIFLREVIESRAFRESASKLTIALGKTIDGLNYVGDLAKMPHLADCRHDRRGQISRRQFAARFDSLSRAAG